MQLVAQQISVQRAGAPQPALRNVTVSVESSEAVAVMGASGAGKSTLAMVLAGLLAPTSGVLERRYAAHEQHSRGNLGLAQCDVAMVVQRPEDAVFAETVEQDVGFALEYNDVAIERRRGMVRDALAAVGMDLAEFGARDPIALSGGERRRVAIAGVLAAFPRIAIFDEPTAGLDTDARHRILTLLAELRDRGIGIVMISHDAAEVARVCRRLVVVAEGDIRYDGPLAPILADVAMSRAVGIEPPAGVGIATRVASALGVAPPLTLDEAEIVDFLARSASAHGSSS